MLISVMQICLRIVVPVSNLPLHLPGFPSPQFRSHGSSSPSAHHQSPRELVDKGDVSSRPGGPRVEAKVANVA